MQWRSGKGGIAGFSIGTIGCGAFKHRERTRQWGNVARGYVNELDEVVASYLERHRFVDVVRETQGDGHMVRSVDRIDYVHQECIETDCTMC